jgi:hypothetical protein
MADDEAKPKRNRSETGAEREMSQRRENETDGERGRPSTNKWQPTAAASGERQATTTAAAAE